MEPIRPQTDPATESAAEQEDDPRAQLEKRFRNGASWFFWVAGLSLINSAVVLFGGEWGFIFGLGVTQVVDGIAAAVAEEAQDVATAARLAGFAVNLLIVGVVALMGWLAHRRKQSVFVGGLVLYLFDALLFLLAADFLSLAFHAWVFVAVGGGFLACRKLAALDAPSDPALQPA